ncbi:MAG: GYDIA family GHMP kinase [Bacteroidales bacterium]|nr:GYDIA family GHMP kinase [Bacteroidales bacterium]
MKLPIEFHANGKLLLTGEYLVLAGARALALPVRFGQHIFIHEISGGIIEWESVAPDGTWFRSRFDTATFRVISTDNHPVATGLATLLGAARSMNPDFLPDSTGWNVRVTATFPLAWGFGSSSTLCSLVARWAEVPAFDLFRMISQGSGYDIACATRQSLLYYRLIKGQPEITPAVAGKALRENTWFAYIGNKQDSASEVASFLQGKKYSGIDLEEVSRLSSAICNAGSPDELIAFVNEHEAILSAILGREPISGSLPSFPGTVKSLGAWGGDFAMFVSSKRKEDVVKRLHEMGFYHLFSYQELEIAA